MVDSDLVQLYGVDTKNLKRTVRMNIERFPEDFMFELTPACNKLCLLFVTPICDWSKYGLNLNNFVLRNPIVYNWKNIFPN